MPFFIDKLLLANHRHFFLCEERFLLVQGVRAS